MDMQNTEKLQIFAQYLDGSMQSWGYDGKWFGKYDDMLADVAKDFPSNFAETYKNVVGLLFVWGEGLPLGEELENVPTKELSPVYGEELVQAVSEWLTEIGVYQNGN